MNFDLSSLLIGVVAMDIIACIEVIIFVKIISKRMGWKMRIKPIKISKRKPVIVNNYYYSDNKETKEAEEVKVYRDAHGRYCKKEDAAKVETSKVYRDRYGRYC